MMARSNITEMNGYRVGDWFSVPWSANPHRLDEIRPHHCQLHGEFIGYEICLRKRRNSEVRPWGGLHVTSIDDARIKRIGAPA